MKKIIDNIITDKAQREELMNRIDVLEKVKHVITLPGAEVMTTRQVADFYGVSMNIIHKCHQRNFEEINSNGVALAKPDKETMSLKLFDPSFNEKPAYWDVSRSGQSVHFVNDIRIEPLGVHKSQYRIVGSEDDATIAPRGNFIFSIRAVLNIGMLLEGSDIAREVRNQLLNTWDNAPLDVRTKELDEEKRLSMEVAQLMLGNDEEKTFQAFGKLVVFKNKIIARLESELDQRAAELSSVSQELNVANERIADNKVLIDKITADNDALYANIRTLPPRRLVVSMMRSFAQHLHSPNPYALAYNCLYKALRDQWGIELRGRKTEGNLLDTVADDEWPKLIKTAATLCTEKHMNLHAIFGDANIDQIAAAEDVIESEETA